MINFFGVVRFFDSLVPFMPEGMIHDWMLVV